MSLNFHFARTPDIIFGSGSVARLPAQINRFGNHILLITGAGSLESSGVLDTIITGLERNKISYHRQTLNSEPSPDFVDRVASQPGQK